MASRLSTVLLLLSLAPGLAFDGVCDSAAAACEDDESYGVSLLQTASQIKGSSKAAGQHRLKEQLQQLRQLHLHEEEETEQQPQQQQQELPEQQEALSLAAGASTAASRVSAGASLSWGAAVAEFVAMTLFVVIGCGSAMGIAKTEGYAWVLQVSLTFGFAITVLAYTIGHFSGGHINCAVTLGLVLVGKCSLAQGILNLIAQIFGSYFGAHLLTWVYPEDKDLTGNLASNSVGEGWSKGGALIGEVIGTFLLMFVVLETAINPETSQNREMACLAIGLAVFLAHSVLIPIDGCSINPTRSIGPAIVARSRSKAGDTFKDMWVFWVGPLVGAAIAAGVYSAMNKLS